VPPWSFSEATAAEKHMPQLQHTIFVGGEQHLSDTPSTKKRGVLPPLNVHPTGVNRIGCDAVVAVF
jgi:hypothetical protein